MSAQENNFYLVRHLINKAEIAIVNNEYKIALEAYDSAFSLENGKFIFFRDYFNDRFTFINNKFCICFI